jgi:hypothetical protein
MMRVPTFVNRLLETAHVRDVRLAPVGLLFGGVECALIFIAFIVILVALWLPEPETMVVANVRAETMAVSVADGDDASFRLNAATRDGGKTCLRDVKVRPDPESTVTYTRRIGEPLIVGIQGGASYAAMNAPVQHSARLVVFALDTTEPCRSAPAVRLPVVGVLMVGSAAIGGGDMTQMPILSGNLDVYARATSKIGPIPLDWLNGATSAATRGFFHVESLDVPAGARIGYTRTLRNRRGRSPWWGFADVNLADRSERGMLVEASTSASELEILNPLPPSFRQAQVLPAGEDAPDEPPAFDVISLKLGARLLGDPNLRWLFTLMTVIIALLSVSLQAVSTITAIRPPKPREPPV